MRISDWSSDVCSSDLRNANAGIVVGINPEQDFPGDPLAGVELQERLESRAYELGGSDYCAPAQLVGDFIRGVPSTEIGRASCRERVCQYVYISVVAVSLKKK